MHKDLFWLDGMSCEDVGIHLQGPMTFSAPVPKVETISVPGRNGDLHFFEGAFENVTGSVDCFILNPSIWLSKALAGVADWALSYQGYRRLEVSNEPEVFRQAMVEEGPETAIRMRTLAPFSLKFSCKPQRFLKSGEKVIHLTQSGSTLKNPGMPSLPLLAVYGSGSGSLTIGGVSISFKDSFSGPVVLDCNVQDAYCGATNKNSEISASQYPAIPSGVVPVNWAGGVDHVDVVPRWWML